MSPDLARLLALRRLLGLRSPLNTVARLLDPFDAKAGVDGVFHPPYVALHLAAAERLGRPRLLVLKGGGGEAERNPAKPVAAHLHVLGAPARELALPAVAAARPGEGAADLRRVWEGAAGDGPEEAVVVATVALGLLALGEAATPREADERAREVWRDR